MLHDDIMVEVKNFMGPSLQFQNEVQDTVMESEIPKENLKTQPMDS